MVMVLPLARKWVLPAVSSVARGTGMLFMVSSTVAGAVQVMVYQVPAMVFSVVVMVCVLVECEASAV